MAHNEPIDWLLVQLPGDEKPGAAYEAPDGNDVDDDSLSDPEPEAPEPDPDGYQFFVPLPESDDVEVLSFDKELARAEETLTDAVSVGYWLQGPEYFTALRGALDGPLANEYQGSHEPLRMLAADKRARLRNIAHASIEGLQEEIRKAQLAVQTRAQALALADLTRSRQQVLDATTRYILAMDSPARARRWLDTSPLAGGALAFGFTQAPTIDLVASLFRLWNAYREVAAERSVLDATMLHAGPEMQRVAAARWQFLRDRDRANTPRDTYRSTEYGIELLRAVNSKHPELVAEALEKYPEPAVVSAARAAFLAKAAALTATLVDEADAHPLLYRIWNPALATELHSRFDRPDMQAARAESFAELFNFRYLVSDALRSTWRGAEAMLARFAKEPSLVWRYPILIQRSLDDLKLPLDAFARIAAEHRVDQLVAEEAQTSNSFRHASQVLAVATLAVRFVPVPAVSVPIAAVLTAVDFAVSGISLLREYLAQSETRDAFRSFLAPGDNFAASDGSYVGVVVGAAFLLFGMAGLKRSSFEVPTRVEVGLTGGMLGLEEYLAPPSAKAK
jgi:hypothetical protein